MEALDTLIKAIKDGTDAIKNARADEEVRVKSLVEETLKTVLRQHPGVTPERKLVFEGMPADTEGELFASLPKEVQAEADKMYLLSSITRKPIKALKRYGNFRKMFVDKGSDFAKALDSTTAGGVDEWVPTELSPNLVEKIRLQLKVAALFQTVQMPSNPYQLPVEIGDFDSFLQPENTGDTGQTIIPVGDTSNISANATFTAKGHMTRVLASKEASEDSIIPILPLIERKIVQALANGREDIFLNGDNTGSHMDSDTAGGSSQARRKLTKGLRALAYLNSYTRDLSTLSLNNLLDMIGDMGVYGVSAANTAWITSISGMIALAKIEQLQTLDKVGAGAVVLNGQVGTCLGRPVIVSEFQRNDLDTTGIYAASSAKTTIILANRDAIALGEKSRPTTQLLTELYAVYNQNALLATERIDIQSLFPIASSRVVNLGINVG
jgi:HK97 family phage major capsid protein